MAFALIFGAAGLTVFGQADNGFDLSKIPATGRKASDFAPKGWRVEDEILEDVTDDRIKDLIIKLIEDKPSSDDIPVDRNRILVIAIGTGEGNFEKAAANDRLLQCTTCGGAFYGMLDAPADVSVEKGVIVISQESGSRRVSNSTYRFRYDQQPAMFILIGFDYAVRDRADGSVATESTNYLTGRRISEKGKGRRTAKKTTAVTKMRYSISEVEAADFESDAAKRLGI
jgi:hypothetical protein